MSPYNPTPSSRTTPTSMFSPSSSATAFSRSPSPPTSAKFFGLPSFTLTTGTGMDEEKAGLGIDSPLSLGKRVGGGRKRRRRLVGQVVGVLVMVGITGWWVGYGDSEGLARIWNGSNRYLKGEIVQPGIVIGEGGTFPPLSPTPTPTTPYRAPYDTTPPLPIQTWGLDLSSTHLLSGLKPFPQNPKPEENQPPLSPLGHFADDIYLLGPLTLHDYNETMLNFAEVAFPKKVRGELKEGLKRFLSGDVYGEGKKEGGWRGGKKKIWQTDKDEGLEGSGEVKSWKNGKAKDEGWGWDLMTDKEADKWVKKMLGGSRMEEVWKALPSGILRSDALRYLLLLFEGGIYTDTDTGLLKSPSHWGQKANLFRNGAGWVDEASLKRIGGGESVEDVLGEPNVVVGIEADVGDRDDWFDWWPRPMQIVQWTMASVPYHPIALNAMLRILHATAKSVDWAHEHEGNIKALKSLGQYKDMQALRETTVLDEPKMGGSVGVMAWTGPGVWTDAVLSYLRVKYGLLWTDLKDIREPLRVGDVVILPVTGFSPAVGNFGSQPTWHKQAMVEHKFRGSWKPKEEGKRRR